MKKNWLILLIGTLILFPCAFCTGLYLYEWISHERTLRQWLNEDDRRVDLFQLYSTYPSKEQLREILLSKFPPGTPEEEIKAFYLANTEEDQKDWYLEKYSHENRVTLTFYATNRGHGHALQRILDGRIIIIFILTPVDNSLRDITVHKWGDSL